MNDLERIRNEIMSILLLIVTLLFTSSNLTQNSLENESLSEGLPFLEVIN